MWDNSDKPWDVKIDIEADNGVYLLGGSSADGKTWLCEELSKMGLEYRDTVEYTYDDYRRNITLDDMIKNTCDGVPSVIMIDRYDMYPSVLNDDIKKYADKSIVLVGANNTKIVGDIDYDVACVYILKNNIRVAG